MARSQLSRALLFLAAALHGTPVLAIPAAGCTKGVVAKPGDSCVTISSSNGITVSQFIQFNPTMQGCNLVAGATYCVATGNGVTISIPPIPTQQPTPPPSPPANPTTGAATPTGSLESSPDGSDGICGGGYTCLGSVYGDCCSLAGYCGNSTEYCVEDNCNPIFGRCGGGDDGGGAEATVTVTVAGPTVTVTKTVTASSTAAPKPSPTLQGTVRNCE